MAEFTPMMQHYLQTKKENPGCILFYRLGDFYEMFFDDAVLVSRELELTLTGKSCGMEERAPMCGIPYHALDNYLSRLVNKGYKVAICEQVEDPKEAKGMVKREVVRIVTPGTNIDNMALDETKNNYIMSIAFVDDKYGIAVADVTTADFLVTELDSKKLLDEIYKYNPSEIVCNEAFLVSGFPLDEIRERLHLVVSSLDAVYFDEKLSTDLLLKHFKTNSLESLGLREFEIGTIAAGALLKYLYEIQKSSLEHMTHIRPYINGNYMMLDHATRRNLELVETLREKQKRGSLLWVLDKTKTAMGARTLRSYIEQPLNDYDEIIRRHKAIEEINRQMITREELREYLNPIYDLERIMTKVIYQTANPRDLLAFKTSIAMLPPIKSLLADYRGDLLRQICEDLDPLEDLHALIDASISEDPPISVRDGDIIKDGYSEDIDHYRDAKTKGKQWLADLEIKEREKTGIKNLKVKYNKVFGYYLEVTNSYKDLVPDYFIRKQTLANAERYFTPELKELEDTILGAEDKLTTLEYEYFREIREHIASQIERIQKTAKAVANLDVFLSLAYVAETNHYCKPRMNKKGIIDIKSGRHPVVEKMIPNDMFIENDVYLDNQKHRVSIITGPNMAGKSTYMRQVALIVLMAQIGSFVPAKEANIGIVDRIFTRVGASDDLASGQSTFMVEMNEVANILRNATSHSLLILDEIGRGTSTFDGLSIAWAVVEHVSNTRLLGAKTLFATHYHELTELEGTIAGVKNYCIAVKEQGDDIVFLRKIVRGGADKSYGIQVAKLAGVPESVIARAKEIAQELTEADITAKAKEIAQVSSNITQRKAVPKPDEVDMQQLTFFDTVKDDDIIRELGELEINTMSPMDALNTLYRLQNKLKNRWKE